eukprot:1718291-Amphidinium_carterae.1
MLISSATLGLLDMHESPSWYRRDGFTCTEDEFAELFSLCDIEHQGFFKKEANSCLASVDVVAYSCI